MTSTIGRYQIIRPLGSGGMADVWLAHDPVLDRDVAVKAPQVERLGAETLARFKIEAKAVARLEHPAIVPLYDYGDQDGRPYLVTRFMPGGSPADRIGRRAFSLNEASAIIDRIAAALDFAHSQGVLHRDVKPGNILFDDAGTVYLADFGIARLMNQGGEESLTGTGLVIGTVAYMSPEQVLGKPLDGRSDIYSLGVVLFEMLAGNLPYKGDSGLQQAMQHVNAPIPDIRARRPDLPPALQNVVNKALAKDPRARYPTGAALAADLRRVAAGGKRGFPIWVWPAALVGLALAAFLLFNRPAPPEPAAEDVIAGQTVEKTNPVAQPRTTNTGASETAAPQATSTPAEPAPASVQADEPAAGNELEVPVLPDEIVFQSIRDGDYEIYIMDLNDGNQRQLTFNDTDDTFPRVSLDGQRIAFASERAGNPEIYVMNRDGSEQTRLTYDPAVDSLPTWSPDVKQIAFQSRRDGDKADIFIMNADGTDVRQITDTREGEYRMSWSIDDRLVYQAALEAYWQIYVSNIDGTDRRKITNSTFDEWSPQWSPDGEWILFHSERTSTINAGIFIMRPDGSDARLIYNSEDEEWGASWSADGRQILFAVTNPDDSDDIYIMDADGGNVRRLLQDAGSPSWAVGGPVAAPENVPAAIATPTPAAGDVRVVDRGGVSAEQVFVPAGSFRMGTNGGKAEEQPIHDVTVDAFWLDRTEVTNAQFAAFVQATGLQTKAERDGRGHVYTVDSWQPLAGADWRHPQGPDSAADPDHPVVLVTWEEAAEFCAWAGGRLPTEAEWEFAARGPESLPFPWGSERDTSLFNSCDINCPYEWRDATADDGYRYTAPVGSYPGGASWVGALDMVGNVWEWVNDWYDEDAYTEAPRVNPTGPDSGALRVIRGVAWVHAPGIHYAANRGRGFPNSAYNGFGFRCAGDWEGDSAGINTPVSLTALPGSAPLPGVMPGASVVDNFDQISAGALGSLFRVNAPGNEVSLPLNSNSFDNMSGTGNKDMNLEAIDNYAIYLGGGGMYSGTC